MIILLIQMNRLNILKLSDMIMHKLYIFRFITFHMILPIKLRSCFNIKSYFDEMISVNIITRTIVNL